MPIGYMYSMYCILDIVTMVACHAYTCEINQCDDISHWDYAKLCRTEFNNVR